MKTKSGKMAITAVILDERTEVSLDDLCRTCRVDQRTIISLVEEGIVEPNSRNVFPWSFSSTTLPVVARAIRLQRDFSLNVAGVAFALDLLGEIDRLRKQIQLSGGETGKADD